ncbi:MAG: universal stress protein, partial [Gemmatimonadota bacterium]
TVLYVETGAHRAGPWRRLRHWLRGPGGTLTPIEAHLRHLRDLAEPVGSTFDWRTTRARSASDAILAEAARGYDVILLGAPGSTELQDPSLGRILSRAPCHVVVVRGAPEPRDEPYRHILVPTDGSFFARAALEFAVNLAECSGGRVAVFTVLPESEPEQPAGPAAERRRIREVMRGAVLGPTLKPVTALAEAPVEVRIARSDRPGEAIILETLSSDYDLIVLGAENKALARPLFYGQGTQYVFGHAPCDVAVVVPRL